VKVGTQLGLDTAQAGVFLAFHRDQLQMDRLIANWPDAAQAELRTRLEDIRSVGYFAQDNGRGVAIIAAPVFDEHGLCATVALLNTTEAVSLQPESLQLRQLLSCAHRLTMDMGGPECPQE
jgi:DNA-binding IclR family transcriptional regulator